MSIQNIFLYIKKFIQFTKHVRNLKIWKLLHTNEVFEGTLFLAYQLKQIFHKWNLLESGSSKGSVAMYFECTASSRDSRPSLLVCTNIFHLFSLKIKDSRKSNAATLSD